MTNLTITVDEQTLKKARMRALDEDTSVNAVLREFLEDYAGLREERLEAARRILEDARRGGSGSGPGGTDVDPGRYLRRSHDKALR